MHRHLQAIDLTDPGATAGDPRGDAAYGRRRTARRQGSFVSVSGYLALDCGLIGEAHVLDLSYDGCKIQTDLALSSGQTVKLGVLDRAAINCEVRWCDDGKAGLRFAAPPAGLDEQQRRIGDRTLVAVDATVRRVGRSRFTVRLIDLSPEGCQFEYVERPRIDDVLAVKIRGIEPVFARVCWVEGQSAGVRFRRPIHPAVFELMIKGIEVAGPGGSEAVAIS